MNNKQNTTHPEQQPLTFRQQLIIAALNGALANPEFFNSNARLFSDPNETEKPAEAYARIAIAAADGVIERLEKETQDAS